VNSIFWIFSNNFEIFKAASINAAALKIIIIHNVGAIIPAAVKNPARHYLKVLKKRVKKILKKFSPS
jgi:hypothetical protein